MHLNTTQALAIALLTIALTRSTNGFKQTLEWFERYKARGIVFQSGYAVCAVIASLPEFLYSAKAIDFAVQLAKV